MKRVIIIIVLAACAGRKPAATPTLPPPSVPRATRGPAALPSPMARQRVVNRCPRKPAYDVPLNRVPWLDARCLMLDNGASVYQVPSMTNATYIVRAPGNSTPVPQGDLVYIIGQGPYVPPTPQPQPSTWRVTFRFRRTDPYLIEESIPVSIYIGKTLGNATLLKQEVVRVPAGAEYANLTAELTCTQVKGPGIIPWLNTSQSRSEWFAPGSEVSVERADIGFCR